MQDDTDSSFHLVHQVVRQGADLLAEGLVSHGDQLAQEEIAVARKSALAFLDPKPQDAGVFDQTGGCGNDDGRRVTCLVNKIGLKHYGGPELARFGLDARIEIHDIEAPALDFHG